MNDELVNVTHSEGYGLYHANEIMEHEIYNSIEEATEAACNKGDSYVYVIFDHTAKTIVAFVHWCRVFKQTK